MASREYQIRRRAAGLCYDCDALPDVGRSRCRLHLDAASKAKAKYYKKNRESIIPIYRARNSMAREAVLAHYGGHCVCCGESNEVFLTMDHINNNGAIHRRSTPAARNLYQWLKTQGYPEGFQVLCRNCNWAKYALGKCPHA